MHVLVKTNIKKLTKSIQQAITAQDPATRRSQQEANHTDKKCRGNTSYSDDKKQKVIQLKGESVDAPLTFGLGDTLVSVAAPAPAPAPPPLSRRRLTSSDCCGGPWPLVEGSGIAPANTLFRCAPRSSDNRRVLINIM